MTPNYCSITFIFVNLSFYSKYSLCKMKPQGGFSYIFLITKNSVSFCIYFFIYSNIYKHTVMISFPFYPKQFSPNKQSRPIYPPSKSFPLLLKNITLSLISVAHMLVGVASVTRTWVCWLVLWNSTRARVICKEENTIKKMFSNDWSMKKSVVFFHYWLLIGEPSSL